MARKRHNPYAARRRAALREACRQQPVNGLLISNAADVGYLSGFSGSDSFLLLCADAGVLITDGRYARQAADECGDLERYVRTEPLSAAVATVTRQRRLRRLGVQAEDVSLLQRDALARRLRGVRIAAIPHPVAASRAVKDAGEVRAIRRTIRIAQQAFLELLSAGAEGLVGRTERDVAADLDYRMRLGGATGSAFETIVAAGAAAALPHYRPGSRRIRRDQAVLIDWGARAGGYCSDLTRVVVIGRIPPKLARAYDVVRRAQRAGIAAVRPRVKARTVDAAARGVIAEAGFADAFVHGLGHGLGREVHEPPGVSRASQMRLRAGMVVTVEPGIYLPGVGGIRIEDDVLVTPDGWRTLSSLPRTRGVLTLR
ncbi:MAG: aminopeptidase P family protein [Phycisphaerae bacterium]|nr:aminopeptidase P family protein [Phycisphaerae bacterium]